MKNRILIAAIFVLVYGCTKSDPTAPPLENPAATAGMYILNEGGFTKSNSSLTLYVPDSQKVYSDVFHAANGRSLGDVANDMVLHDGKAFIVVNNSHKVEVISTDTHLSLGVIPMPGNSPNKIIIVNKNKGYITNLYRGTVTVFDPSTYTVLHDSIRVGANPQGLIAVNGKLYVCNSGYGFDSTVSVIDLNTDAVIKTITVGAGPTDIGVDSDGEIFVRCSGSIDWSDPGKDTPGSIVIIDPSADEVKSTIPLPLETYGHPSKMVVTKTGQGYVVVKNGIAQFETVTNSIVNFQFSSRQAYSIAFDEIDEKLYVTDAKDFVQNGMLYGINKNGAVTDSAIVGIIPGTIVFKR
ncbi:MAG: DUF5074 domain-containing protein [Bacteroidota bacterium]